MSQSAQVPSPSPAKKFQARFEDKIEYNSRYSQYSFELIKPHRLQFQAGQYISIQVTEAGLRRAYSICSQPQIDHQVDLLVDLSPGGPGSQFFKDLSFGQEVNFLGPLGEFVIPQNLTENIEHLYFIATGSGIAPFKAMIEERLLHHHDPRQLTLHWGMRHADDLFWLDQWRGLTETFENFHFHPVLSQAPDEWSLCRGHVTDCLQVHQRPKKAAYFVCGNKAMIEDVEKILIKQAVDPQLIFYEKYY